MSRVWTGTRTGPSSLLLPGMRQCDYGTQNKRILYAPSLDIRSKWMSVLGIRMGTGLHQAQKTVSSKYTIYGPWRKWKYSGDRWAIFVRSAGIHSMRVFFCQVGLACNHWSSSFINTSTLLIMADYTVNWSKGMSLLCSAVNPSGGYNGSLIYWLCNHNQAPHTLIADAHRQSIDVIAWHPAGHCVGTASHDGILKFWCREPPGAQNISIQQIRFIWFKYPTKCIYCEIFFRQ